MSCQSKDIISGIRIKTKGVTKQMLTQELFQKFLTSKCNFNDGDTVLVGVSGGLDSIVLCDLLSKLKIDFAIAHINYGLRGNESDEDEIFVSNYAKQLNVPIYYLKCSENTFKATGENSIQASARKIRYDFFDESCKMHGYKLIATAHHTDDSIETALLNFARGTGLKGLIGISAFRNNLIRPLLFATREEILAYAETLQLLWREDSSNASDKYTRNRFRHHLLPWLLSEIPQGYEGFKTSFKRLDDSEKLIDAALKHWEDSCCKRIDEKETQISIKDLKKFEQPEIYLRFFLRKNGFPEFSEDSIQNLLYGNAGIEFLSDTKKLLRDRSIIFLLKKENEIKPLSKSPFAFSVESNPKEITNDNWSAIVDSSILTAPLVARIWKGGDKLIPFGMQGHKLVSDILNELKIPAHHKNKAVIIVSGEEIVWIPGYRIADKYKITGATKTALRLTFNKENYGE